MVSNKEVTKIYDMYAIDFFNKRYSKLNDAQADKVRKKANRDIMILEREEERQNQGLGLFGKGGLLR